MQQVPSTVVVNPYQLFRGRGTSGGATTTPRSSNRRGKTLVPIETKANQSKRTDLFTFRGWVAERHPPICRVTLYSGLCILFLFCRSIVTWRSIKGKHVSKKHRIMAQKNKPSSALRNNWTLWCQLYSFLSIVPQSVLVLCKQKAANNPLSKPAISCRKLLFLQILLAKRWGNGT